MVDVTMVDVTMVDVTMVDVTIDDVTMVDVTMPVEVIVESERRFAPLRWMDAPIEQSSRRSASLRSVPIVAPFRFSKQRRFPIDAAPSPLRTSIHDHKGTTPSPFLPKDSSEGRPRTHNFPRVP